MNRREFLATGFRLGAAGLLLPAIEPIRHYWSLDRTMLPRPSDTTGPNCFPGRIVVGDYTNGTIHVTAASDLIWINGEPMWVAGVPGGRNQLLALRA